MVGKEEEGTEMSFFLVVCKEHHGHSVGKMCLALIKALN